MAVSSSEQETKLSVEDKLKKVLVEEIERRRQFSEVLQGLLAERDREKMGDSHATVEDLIDMMDKADASISAQLHDLQETPVSIRERVSEETSQERDSGLPPSPANSGDLGHQKRHGVYRPIDGQPDPELPVPVPETGLPDILNPASLPSDLPALGGHTAGEPTEHSDDTAEDDTN